MQSLADFLGIADPARPDAPDAPASAPLSAREFCRQVLASPEYRLSIYHRITLGLLPPGIESLLWYYAEGKPTERIEHTGKDGQPIETVTEVRRTVVHVNAVAQDEPASPSVH